jgi:hypothetical protein
VVPNAPPPPHRAAIFNTGSPRPTSNPMRRRKIHHAPRRSVGWVAVVGRGAAAGEPLVAFLNGGSADGYAPMVLGFRQGLREAGFVEGQNVMVVQSVQRPTVVRFCHFGRL